MAPQNPNNDIAAQWLSFDETRRKSLLSRMTPEQKRNLRTALENHHSTIVPAGKESTPGVVGRTLEGLGIPKSKQELIAAAKLFEIGPNELDTDIIGKGLSYIPILGPVYRLGEAFGSGLHEAAGKGGQEVKEAARNIREGGPIGANTGKAVYGIEKFGMEGLLGPFGGGSVQAFGEDIGSKNYSGAAGDAIAVLLNAMLMKHATPMTGKGKANVIASVADLSKGGEDLKTVLPDIEKASKGQAPKTIGGLLDTVNKAKDDMNTQSGLAMQSVKGQQIVPMGISNRIKARITPDMIQTSEGRSTEQMFKDAAVDFQKPWTFEQLDALRRRWWPETKAFRNASPADRAALLKADPRLAVKVDVVDAIRDLVYPAMDRAAGKPVGFFEGLKQRQSILIDLQKHLESQADALHTESMKIKGSSRFSSKNLSVYAAGTKGAHPGFSLHRLSPFHPNPEGQANRMVSRAFTGGKTGKAAIYSYPVRKLLPEMAQSKKKPGEQIKDLRNIQQKYTSNPAMPIAEQ